LLLEAGDFPQAAGSSINESDYVHLLFLMGWCLLTFPSPCRQVKMAHQPITPSEYDEAALRVPHCCPLVAMGDSRSGQELVDDVGTDSVQTVEAMAGTVKGRSRLDRLAQHLHAQLNKLERIVCTKPQSL
jgi:hypothetical protein